MSRIPVVLSVGICLLLCGSVQAKSAADINAKVAQIDIGSSSLDDVIGIFGEPTKYMWGGKTFTRANLPGICIAAYPKVFHVVIAAGKVQELRFQGPGTGYLFKNKLKVGSSLQEVLAVLGNPKETVVGKPNGLKGGVLYKDIDGKKGRCYYNRPDHKIRIFFADDRIAAFYLTGVPSVVGGGGGSFQSVRPIASVAEFDDVRWKDMSSLDLSRKSRLITTLKFNEKTRWPSGRMMPAALDPKDMMLKAMNPGLGVRSLHREGITGKGVNVAIIDQPLYKDHPEFAGKIVAYHDVGCPSKSSMHGPAVASFLVGNNCGTAPDARLYYVAAPSWTGDTSYQAKALDWIVEQNKRLPKNEKIRVVSVSANPSGRPFEKNLFLWDHACRRAEDQGILVLDCTSNRGFIGPCFSDRRRPEDVTKCTPGYRNMTDLYKAPTHVLAPTCPRTCAEQYDRGDFSYTYGGKGGLSWAIPYSAGVLAMGWQIRPDLGPRQMRNLLFESAYKTKDGNKIINPKKFIQFVTIAPRGPRN